MIVDVVIMAALPVEHAALQEVLKRVGSKREEAHDGHFALYNIFHLDNDLRVVLTQPTGPGQLNAAVATGRVLYDLHPRLVLLGGIAGCMGFASAGECKLGDVVISDLIIDYELEKIREAEIEKRPGDIQACDALIALINERSHSWPGDFAGWLPPRPSGDPNSPTFHVGNVFSGNQVLASSAAKAEFLAGRRNAIAIEMESAGVAAAVKGMHFPERVLMVKSFSDWADGTKSDVFREYACRVSATFIAFLLLQIVPIYLRKAHDAVSADEDRHLFARRVKYAFDSFLRTQARPIPFLKEIADAICNQAIIEATTLASVKVANQSHYEAKIGTGYQFLLRARPLFQSAKRVVVTSLDSISTFWIDPLSRTTVRDYISAQGRGKSDTSIKRLFVFSSAESAHRHARVLDYHAQLFNDTFVCSQQEYERYLDRIAPGAQAKYLRRDFAILECPTEGGDRSFFTDLDADSFSIQPALFDSEAAEVDCKATFDLFDQFSGITPGVFDPTWKVLKWERGHWRDTTAWENHLTKMFGGTSADVFHVVLFNKGTAKPGVLREALGKIKYELFGGAEPRQGSLASKYGIKDVWLAKLHPRDSKPLFDDTTGGKLSYSPSSGMTYVLAIRLPDQDKLVAFMRDPEHLKIRLKVFSQLGGSVESLMHEFEMGEPSHFDQYGEVRGKILYESLESMASVSMKRFDYNQDESISELVRFQPPPFP